MPLRVVGLDLSLASSGHSNGEVTQVCQTTSDESLERRLDTQVRSAVLFSLHADLVVIESGAFARGAQSAAAEYLAALRLMVRCRLWRMGIPYAMVPPSTLKAATTGRGNATKDEIVAAVDERHGTDFAKHPKSAGRYDRADALALAAMGYEHVGQPLPYSFPAPPLRAESLAAVKWPELFSDEG